MRVRETRRAAKRAVCAGETARRRQHKTCRDKYELVNGSCVRLLVIDLDRSLRVYPAFSPPSSQSTLPSHSQPTQLRQPVLNAKDLKPLLPIETVYLDLSLLVSFVLHLRTLVVFCAHR